MSFSATNYQPSWTLFFSWGAFVFLSVNFFTGVLLSNVDKNDFIMGCVIAFTLLAFTLYPTVYLSIKYNINYSQAIQKFISNKTIQFSLIALVVLINLGWYSIQLTAINTLLTNHFEVNSLVSILILSYLFAYGSYKFDYEWLKSFGVITIVLFLVYLVSITFTLETDTINDSLPVSNISLWSIVILLYGTWAFSSSTVVMDVARYTKDFKKSYIAILLAMVFSNFLLIALGYMFGRYTNIDSFEEFVLFLGIGFGVLLFVLNIWSTNDSNFFSSSKALQTLGVKKQISFIALPLLSAMLAINFQDDLFSIIGSWLKLMGWITIPLTLFWWYVIFKSVVNDK